MIIGKAFGPAFLERLAVSKGSAFGRPSQRAKSLSGHQSAGKVLGKPSPGVFLSAKHTIPQLSVKSEKRRKKKEKRKMKEGFALILRLRRRNRALHFYDQTAQRFPKQSAIRKTQNVKHIRSTLIYDQGAPFRNCTLFPLHSILNPSSKNTAAPLGGAVFIIPVRIRQFYSSVTFSETGLWSELTKPRSSVSKLSTFRFAETMKPSIR